jgi:hypothetical protein
MINLVYLLGLLVSNAVFTTISWSKSIMVTLS